MILSKNHSMREQSLLSLFCNQNFNDLKHDTNMLD